MMQKARSKVSREVWIAGALLTLAWLVVYLATVSPTVNFIDSGELITAVHEPGVVHPPGYPLYTLLGYVVSHLLWGEVAWRVNALSAFFGAMAVGAMFLFLVEVTNYTRWLARPKAAQPQPQPRRKSQKPAPRQPAQQVRQVASQALTPANAIRHEWTMILSSAAGASLLGAASTFWNRSTQAKMYTIHYFFVVAILLAALEYRWSYERGEERQSKRWLVALAAGLGLSLTNHLMTTLLAPGILLLLVWGKGWLLRARGILGQWRLWLPALALPLLLYLYLPLRASQGPVMNWGSTDNLGDFWRHIRGWQYGAYLFIDMLGTFRRLVDYASVQWSWLTLPALLLGAASGALLAMRNLPVFLATFSLAFLTFLFNLAYSISEIEPYMVPLYAMVVVWLGVAPSLIDGFLRGPAEARQPAGGEGTPGYGLPAAALLAVVAIVSALVQFPRQNHSNDHLAELFVQNAFQGFEQNAIVITDHWDLYSPAYYMQLVRGVRPDVVLIDKSALRYPWYLGQLEKRYPWLVANSKDLVEPFRVEQRRWVNGEALAPGPNNQPLLQKLYIDLLNSFIERNYDQHPAYVFFPSNCEPGSDNPALENNQIAPTYFKQPSGIALRLWREQPPAGSLPPMPEFDLRGITYDKTPMDEFAIYNSTFYQCGYGATAQAYADAKRTDQAEVLASKAQQLRTAMQGR
jgi:hypothetical protein